VYASNQSRDQGGSVVNKAPQTADDTVQLTAMHANFTIECVQDWLIADYARQEQGVVDTLDYLNEAMLFLMRVTKQNQGFAEICREQKADQEDVIARTERTIAFIETLKMPLDATKLAQGNDRMRQLAAHLEAGALSHDSTVEQLTGLFDQLQERVAAVMRVPGKVAGPLLAN